MDGNNSKQSTHLVSFENTTLGSHTFSCPYLSKQVKYLYYKWNVCETSKTAFQSNRLQATKSWGYHGIH